MTRFFLIRQAWLESERGWGTRPDGYSYHVSEDGLRIYIQEYWDSMPDEAPDEYSRPCGDPKRVQVGRLFYEQVKSFGKSGFRTMEKEDMD